MAVCVLSKSLPLYLSYRTHSATHLQTSPGVRGRRKGVNGVVAYIVSGIYTSREGNEKQLFVCLE